MDGTNIGTPWRTVLSWLPPPLQSALGTISVPPEEWTELRLRVRGCVSVTAGLPGTGGTGNWPLSDVRLSAEGLREILARICGGSVHAYDAELRRGYLSAGNGIRVGVCGRALCGADETAVERLRSISSLCIRLPHTVNVRDADAREALYGLCSEPFSETERKNGEPLCSTLFYAPPGCGKTTLLRGLIQTLTNPDGTGLRGAVIDTGEELAPETGFPGMTDIFSAYPRGAGISLAVRAFSPQVIFCDEIGTEEEAEAILRAQSGGVPLIATAHAETLESLLRRPCFEELFRHRVFSRFIRVRAENGAFRFFREYPE